MAVGPSEPSGPGPANGGGSRPWHRRCLGKGPWPGSSSPDRLLQGETRWMFNEDGRLSSQATSCLLHDSPPPGSYWCRCRSVAHSMGVGRARFSVNGSPAGARLQDCDTASAAPGCGSTPGGHSQPLPGCVTSQQMACASGVHTEMWPLVLPSLAVNTACSLPLDVGPVTGVHPQGPALTTRMGFYRGCDNDIRGLAPPW